MSPEKLMKKPYDYKADVYSAGAILLIMMTNHLPDTLYDEGDKLISLPITKNDMLERILKMML